MEMRKGKGNFGEKHIILFIIFMICCILLNNLVTSAVTAPYENDTTVYYLLVALCKYITALLPLILMARWKLMPKAKMRNLLPGLLFGAPCIILIAENLLPLTLADLMLFQVQWLPTAAIILAYFGVGLMEEAGCRGVLLPLLCRKWSGPHNGYMKAALFSSGLFACTHIIWIVNALIFQGSVSLAECVGRLYQVYYAFCFGMLAAGVTLYAKSIIPMVIWHSLIDVSAFIDRGLMPRVTYQNYYDTAAIGLDKALIQMGILKTTGIAYWGLVAGLDAIPLAAGIFLIKKSQKREAALSIFL